MNWAGPAGCAGAGSRVQAWPEGRDWSSLSRLPSGLRGAARAPFSIGSGDDRSPRHSLQLIQLSYTVGLHLLSAAKTATPSIVVHQRVTKEMQGTSFCTPRSKPLVWRRALHSKRTVRTVHFCCTRILYVCQSGLLLSFFLSFFLFLFLSTFQYTSSAWSGECTCK
jgi:hypothetical protein